MRNWGTGRRGLSRSYDQPVSSCNPGRLTLHLSIFSVISQYPSTLDLLPFHSIPFQLVPDPDQTTVLASILPFGHTDSVGFPCLKSWHSLSGFDLQLLLCLTTLQRTPSPVGFYYYCYCCFCSHNNHNLFCYYSLSGIVLDTL